MRPLIACIAIVFLYTACETGTQPNRPAAAPDSVAYLNTLRQGVTAAPDSAGARLALADALDSLGHGREAIGQLDSLIRKDSNNYDLWFKRARFNESAHDTTAAIMSYVRALHVYRSPDGMLSLAFLLAETRNAQSLLLCDNVREMNQGSKYAAHCDFISGVYYARTRNTAMANRFLDRCINDDYTYIQAYFEKGYLQYDAGRYPAALEIFRTAASVSNTNPDVYYWQAKCYEAMHDARNAIASYRRSLSLDKNLVEAAAGLKRLGQ